MRAVKGSLGHSLKRGRRIRLPSPGLMADFWKSIAKSSECRLGENVARNGRNSPRLSVSGMMKKLNWACFAGGVLICAWSLFPLLTHAAEDEGDGKALQEVREVVKQLQARYEKTKDLSGRLLRRKP